MTEPREALAALLHKETWLSHGLPPEADCGYCATLADRLITAGGGQDDADGDLGHAVIAEYAALPAQENPTPARSEGPGLDALAQMVFRLNTFTRHRPWCPEFRGPGDCTCGLYVLLDSILCTCGHKVSVHTTRDVADVAGWPCSECRSARCPRFALAAQETEASR